MRLIALAGVFSISFSAVFIRLAHVSPVTATFFRAAYAVPVLAAIWLARRADDGRPRREHWLAFVSGVLLAADDGRHGGDLRPIAGRRARVSA